MSSPNACHFFQSPQGCFRGSSCTFLHNNDASTVNITLTATNPYIPTPNPLRTCHFFASESGCRNGNNCPFVHTVVDSNTSESFESVTYDEMVAPQLPPVAMSNGSAGVYNKSGLAIMRPPDYNESNKTIVVEKNNGNTKLQFQGNLQLQETISEILPVLTRDIEGPFFAIDVECVATGNGTNDRDVARIAVVDVNENVVFDQYVKPGKPIVSYLTQLTGITKSNLKNAPDLNEALIRLKQILPVTCVIVGQSIKKDLEWLTLQKPLDYKAEFDVADLFRLPMQSTNGIVRYRYFSLRHVAKYLLGHEIQEADHDPVIDAQYAMKVFKKFRYLHENPSRRDAVLQTLLKTPRTPSFAERYPVIDGVSMRAPRKQSTFPH